MYKELEEMYKLHLTYVKYLVMSVCVKQLRGKKKQEKSQTFLF